MERTSPQELAQQRSRRQIIIRYTLEILQELQAAGKPQHIPRNSLAPAAAAVLPAS